MAQEVRNIRSSVRVGFLTLSVVTGTSAITFDGSGTATTSKTVLFYEPFDNLTAWTLGSGGTATITAGGQVGTFVRNSGGAARGHPLAAGDQSNDFDLSFWWRCNNVGTALVTVISISSTATTLSPQEMVVTVPTDKSWRLQNGSNIYGTTAANAVVANVWYRVRLVCHMASPGTVRLDIDGVTVLSDTTRTTYTSTPNIGSVWTSGINGLTEDYDELILDTGGGAPVTTGTGAITFAGAGVASVVAGGVSTGGTGAITFAGSGTATQTSSATGTGAITFAGAGLASTTGLSVATGTGAITFAGAGTATLTFGTSGTGAITFDGDGTATTVQTGDVSATGHGAITFAARGDADVAPLLDVYTPPEWSWLVLQPDGTPIGPLTVASARKLTFQLDGASSASFTMPGEHPQTATITELATDVYVGRNGRPLFRGRIGGSTETHSALADNVNLAATDYRGLLDHRLIWPESTLEYAGADQSDIAWQLIAESQALGDLGITRGIGGVTGVARDRKFTPGIAITQAIKGLAGVADGFDWEIDAYLAFNLYHPQRGRDNADPTLLPTLTYGRDVVAVTTTVDPGKYANAVYFTGSTSETTAAEAIATPPAGVGRWERQLADPNATLQATVDEEAAGKLAEASQLISALTVTLAADVWNPYVLWLGDMVRVLIRTGRLDLDVTRRIVQIDVSLDDTGIETVTLNIGAAPAKLSDRLNSLQNQLSQLQVQPGGGSGGDGTGGPGGGGIQEITSSDGSVTVVHPTGPVTDLSVAFAIGGLVVTNPTGPIVDLSYVTQSETVHSTYGSVGLLSDLAFDHAYGYYSFAAELDSPASWLVSRPNGSVDGGVGLINNGEAVSQIIGPGYYDLSVHVETTVVPMGVDVDGNVIVFPIGVRWDNFPPFGSPVRPGDGTVDGFICGLSSPRTLTWGRVLVTEGMLASGDQWAVFTIRADAGPPDGNGHLTNGGAISMALTLTRTW